MALGAGMKRGDRLASFISESEGLVAKVGSYLDSYKAKHEQEMRAQENRMHAAAGGDSGAAAAAAAPGGAVVSSSSASGDSQKRRLSVNDSGDDQQKEKVFYQATDYDIEAIRPMFEILWYPCLATFSVLLEEDQGASNKADDTGAAGSGNGTGGCQHASRAIEL